jgi:hypothetical protein
MIRSSSEEKVKVNILNIGRLPEGLTGPLYGIEVTKRYYNNLKLLGYRVSLVPNKKPSIIPSAPEDIKESVISEEVMEEVTEAEPTGNPEITEEVIISSDLDVDESASAELTSVYATEEIISTPEDIKESVISEEVMEEVTEAEPTDAPEVTEEVTSSDEEPEEETTDNYSSSYYGKKKRKK